MTNIVLISLTYKETSREKGNRNQLRTVIKSSKNAQDIYEKLSNHNNLQSRNCNLGDKVLNKKTFYFQKNSCMHAYVSILMHLCPWADITKVDSLKQQKFVLSLFWRLDTKTKVPSGPYSFKGSRGESCLFQIWLLLLFFGLWQT